VAGFGLAGGDDFYAAPTLTAGVMRRTDDAYFTPSGLHLALFCRLTEIHVGNAGGTVGKLRPAVGFRLGYAFPGFWGWW
jgi:hypothetical protein